MVQQTKEAIKKAKLAAEKKNKEMKAKEKPYLDVLKDKLTAPFPKEAEQIKKIGSFSLTGYKPAYIVERLNDCFGYKGWHAELIPFDYIVKDHRFDNLIMIEEACVTVWVKLTVVFADDRKPQHHNQFGTCEYHKGSLTVGEAIKGAYTDGLKKCAGYFDIGQEAYKGNVDPYYENNKGAKRQSEKPFSGETRERTKETPRKDANKPNEPTEKQIGFLKQHKLDIPKTRAEASKLIDKRLKELQGRKTQVKEEKKTEVDRLAQSATDEQKEQLIYYEEKYPDVMQEVLTNLKFKNAIRLLTGLTVKGAELIINKVAETLDDLGISPDVIEGDDEP